MKRQKQICKKTVRTLSLPSNPNIFPVLAPPKETVT